MDVSRSIPTEGFRRDIEGLRAVAVIAVLLYHARVPPFGGGYIGVDVFFVISGFLITSILLREATATGTIVLAEFWGRRARRLIPASALVVAATVAASLWLVDPLTQRDVAWDGMLASFGLVINTVYALRQVDYLGGGEGPFQHYWSLAVEESFYVLWPLLVRLTMRRRRPLERVTLTRIVPTATVIWAASFAAGVTLSRPTDNSFAFFLLPTRAWELLTGCLLAMVAARMNRMPTRLYAALGGLGWLGLLAIVFTTTFFSSQTLFPGVAALLPVAATGCVLMSHGRASGPRIVLDQPILQWIGARSYAIYLWHWPMLVLVEARVGQLAVVARVGVTLASVAVAAASYTLLENRVRRDRWLARRPSRSLWLGGLTVLATSAVCAVVISLDPRLDGGSAAAAPTLAIVDPLVPLAADAPPATGPVDVEATTATAPLVPAAVDPGSPGATLPQPTIAVPSDAPGDTPEVPGSTATVDSAASVPASALVTITATMEAAAGTIEVPSNLRPSLRAADGDRPSIYDDGCLLELGNVPLAACEFGDPTSPTTLVLWGDSHAAHWFPGLEAVVTQNGWRLVVFAKKGCPAVDFATYDADGRRREECGPWRNEVLAELAQRPPALVILGSYRYRLVQDPPNPWDLADWRTGLDATLAAVGPLAGQVLVLGDTPNPIDDVPHCLAGHLGDVPHCLRDRSTAANPALVAAEQEVTSGHGAAYVSTADWLCSERVCPVIAGDILLYRDDNHLTATASAWLAPVLDAVIRPLIG